MIKIFISPVIQKEYESSYKALVKDLEKLHHTFTIVDKPNEADLILTILSKEPRYTDKYKNTKFYLDFWKDLEAGKYSPKIKMITFENLYKQIKDLV